MSLFHKTTDADITEAYWRGVTNLFEHIDLTPEQAEKLSTKFILNALPKTGESGTTSNMKRWVVKKILEGTQRGKD